MSNKKDTEWLINKSKSLFGDSLDYTNSFYVDAKTKVTFHCKKHNYTFSQTSNNHFNTKFPCSNCLRESRKDKLSDGLDLFKQKIIALHGDKFIFENANYINQRTPITLVCKKHQKEVIKEPQVFLRGHGCELCTKEENKNKLSQNTLEEINNFVKKLNGKCNSNDYRNNESKLKFECEEGHLFEYSWSAVKNSLRWCPKCSPNKLIGESLARLILEHLLKIKLPSKYIKEMEGLQLDGFDSKTKIAFEYQGYQHYTIGSHFHTNINQYKTQLERDKFKKELCQTNNIKLIEIFEFKTIRAGRIELFVNKVKDKLIELNIKFSNEPFVLDLIELYRGKQCDSYNKAKKIVEFKNGSIQEFIGSESKHIYKCFKGHKITNRTLGVIIKTKASCPICDSEIKFAKLGEVIKSRGGLLLTTKMKPKGLSENYNWICDKGHNCESKGQYLINGSWCAKCQNENQKKKLSKKDIYQFEKDLTSGNYFQKDLTLKYELSLNVFQRIIKELNINPKFKTQDRKNQIKRTKGLLLQIDPNNFTIINKFESLEAVKYDKNNSFKPEGIRHQMKNYKKAYGYYWCRELDYFETLKILNQEISNS